MFNCVVYSYIAIAMNRNVVVNLSFPFLFFWQNFFFFPQKRESFDRNFVFFESKIALGFLGFAKAGFGNPKNLRLRNEIVGGLVCGASWRWRIEVK
jgi:hypothetical protein